MFGQVSWAEQCEAKLRQTEPYQSLRNETSEFVASDAPLEPKLDALATLEATGLNCRELIDAAIMRMTAYEGAGRYTLAAETIERIFATGELPALQGHFAWMIIPLLIRSDNAAAAEPYVDYLYESVGSLYEAMDERQHSLWRYVDAYQKVGASEKAIRLAQDLWVVRVPHPIQKMSESAQTYASYYGDSDAEADVHKLSDVFRAADRGDIADIIETEGYALWIDECEKYRRSISTPMHCGISGTIGSIPELIDMLEEGGR